MKICLCTSYSADFSAIGRYAEATLKTYGARYGIDVEVRSAVSMDRHPAWHRIKFIPELFEKGYDYVFWMDADAIFVRFDVDLRSFIKNNADLYLVQHDDPKFHPTPVPNTGVLMARNTAWTRDLFDKIWGMTQYLDHPWWENAALIELMGYHSLLRGGVDDYNEEILSHIEFLPPEWNYIPSVCNGLDPIILHYAGFERKSRLQALRLNFESAMRRLGSEVSSEVGGVRNEIVIERGAIPMHETPGFWSWFDEVASPQFGRREGTIRRSLKWLDRIPGDIAIVETGSMRVAGNWNGDGQSSLIFDRYVSARGKGSIFFTIDIDPQASGLCQSVLGEFSRVKTGDSVRILSEISEELRRARLRLALIYLDSFDVDFSNPLPSAIHHLLELVAISPALRPETLVVVDDSPIQVLVAPGAKGVMENVVAPTVGGKGMLVADYARRVGAVRAFAEYQVGWYGFSAQKRN